MNFEVVLDRQPAWMRGGIEVRLIDRQARMCVSDVNWAKRRR